MQRRPGLRSLLTIVLALGAVGALWASGADAAPSFSVVSTSTTPDPTTPGSTATITTSIKNSGDLASGVIVDMEIYNSGNVQVFQQYVPGNTFATGESKTFQWAWTTPANQAAGTYTVKIGIFSDHWASLLLWNNSADTFAIGSSGPGVAFSIGTITASPTSVQRGGNVSVTASVRNTGTSPASGIHVLLHLADPFGNDFPDNQIIVSDQNVAAGQTRTFTFQWHVPTNATQGFYTVGIGIFDANWTQLYAWKNSDSAFKVGSTGTPTFAVGATSVSPNPVGRGQTVTVTTNFKNTSSVAAANMIVLCEINNDRDDANITSQYVTGLSYSPGQNHTLSFAFQVNFPPGTYTIDVGIFNGDWSKMYTWGYLVATFTVR
jgi:hypothetical protein